MLIDLSGKPVVADNFLPQNACRHQPLVSRVFRRFAHTQELVDVADVLCGGHELHLAVYRLLTGKPDAARCFCHIWTERHRIMLATRGHKLHFAVYRLMTREPDAAQTLS